MMQQRDIDQAWAGTTGEIEAIQIPGGYEQTVTGHNGVTKIERWCKPGDNAFIPYVRVWYGDKIGHEHSQHALAAVFFAGI